MIRRLTRPGSGSDHHAAVCPDNDTVLFISTRSDGRGKIFQISISGGEAVLLFDAPIGIDSFRIAPSGDFLVFSAQVLLFLLVFFFPFLCSL
jgi:hypothetical protein